MSDRDKIVAAIFAQADAKREMYEENERLRAENEALLERLEKAHSFISRADWMQFFEEEHAFQKESDND